jgi:restriction system protein
MQINIAQIILQSIVKIFAPFVPIFFLLIIIMTIWSIYRYYRLSNSQIFEIDKMTGKEFEDRLAILFRKLGYAVRVVGNQKGDYGVDLVIEKDNIKTAVQAKCYKKWLVGEDAVREVYTGKNYYDCQEGMVITNNYYSKMARNLARANNIKLWDRDNLIRSLLIKD